MGKATKPTKWFKAVKKAFRSPSKERPSPGDTKVDADEKLLTKQDFPPVSRQEPKPHPLPSFEIITQDEAEPVPEHIEGRPLATPQAVDPEISENLRHKEENEVEEEEKTSNQDAHAVEKHQDIDDDDSTLSEEEEAATRIQQRFSSLLALKGLIRLQALVRGHLVRRQAATTLRTMEAIVRVQAVFRGRRVRMSRDGTAVRSRIARTRRLGSRAGTPGDASGGEFQHKGCQTGGAEEEANKRTRQTACLLTQQLKRSTPNRSSLFIDLDPDLPHGGWAWLELWTNARPWENRQLEDTKDTKDSKDSKDYIEIIPSARKSSTYTTKEVDVSTLKKYYEDYITKPAQARSFAARTLSEKKEPERLVPDWQHTSSAPMPSPAPLPAPLPAPPASSTTPHSHRALSKPPPIEVPGTGEDAFTHPALRTPEAKKSPGRVTPSPAVSENSTSDVPPSPQASDSASISAPETLPGLVDSAGDDPSTIMDHLVLPEAHRGNGLEANGASTTHSDRLSVSNGEHQAGEDSPTGKGSASDVVNCHASNGHQENDGNKAIKGERVEENGDSPVPSKRTTCRYMAATESAKAKFRSSSNPKTRTPETPESPGRTQKRYSIGGVTPVSKAADSPKTVFGTRKTNSFRNRRSPSPITGAPIEKPRSVDAGAESPARRNSLGSADGKRWRT